MIDFMKNFTKVGRLTLNSILPGRRKVKIRLVLKDKIEILILILTNVFYYLNNSSNLDTLGLLNNMEIYYHNKDKRLYKL